MSLISEGLKKAQLDAMQQDREQRQAYLRSARPNVPRRAASSVPQMIAIGLGSAVIASAAMLWLRGTHTPPTPAPLVAEVPPHARRSVETPRPKPSAEAAAPEAAPKAALPTTAVEQPAPRAVTANKPPKSVAPPHDGTVVNEESTLPPPKEPPPLRRRDAFVDGETYASPINGPGGTEVRLSGILSAGDGALAIINGSTVHPGVMIGPFVVERVERKRVQLRYIDVHFYLTP